MQSLDNNVLQFLVENRSEWLTFIMLCISYAGGYLVVSLSTILTSLSLYIHNQKEKIIPLIISVSGSAITIFILKNIFDKARPITQAIYLESSPSFPSGHAAAAISLYGFIYAIIWAHEKHHLKNKSLIALSLLIPLIGISRLYLGVHFLSDVLVGYLIGFIWLLVALVIVHAISKSKL